MRPGKRQAAEVAWLDEAIGWAREHPGASPGQLMAAVPNPGGLLVRPLAGAAIVVAAKDHQTRRAVP